MILNDHLFSFGTNTGIQVQNGLSALLFEKTDPIRSRPGQLSSFQEKSNGSNYKETSRYSLGK